MHDVCAPRDQRKSSDKQCKQAQLNALRCLRRPMFRVNCRGFNSRNEWLPNHRFEPVGLAIRRQPASLAIRFCRSLTLSILPSEVSGNSVTM